MRDYFPLFTTNKSAKLSNIVEVNTVEFDPVQNIKTEQEWENLLKQEITAMTLVRESLRNREINRKELLGLFAIRVQQFLLFTEHFLDDTDKSRINFGMKKETLSLLLEEKLLKEDPEHYILYKHDIAQTGASVFNNIIHRIPNLLSEAEQDNDTNLKKQYLKYLSELGHLTNNIEYFVFSILGTSLSYTEAHR